MAAAAFDTLKIVQTLRDKAHFSPEQAEGLAEAMAEAMQGDLATKTDLTLLKAEIRETELRLQAQIKDTEGRLKVEIAASKTDFLKWMIGTIGFQTIILLGGAVMIARMFTK